jgi:dTMP kinase
MQRGTFITLEGGDGSGKSTQTKRLCEFLRSKGIETIQTREVGGSPSAESIRELWLTPSEGHWDTITEVYLIMAARREHLVKTIFPALERGAWVVCDRFIDSTRAYQGIGQDLGLEIIDELYRHIAGDFEPDLTLLLDLPVDVGLSRMTSRGGQDDRYQQKHKDFHQKLRDGFLFLATKNKERFQIVDASCEAAVVTKSIEDVIRQRYQL